jgi:thiosulfate/3-mercaptopyruvate sulfurtransferase
MSRYIVIGAGAVGATIAAELHRAGIDTVLVARGAQLAALRASGLTYVRPDGAHQLSIPVAAGPGEVDLAEDDVLILATKSTDSAAAVTDWAWRPVKRADGSAGVAATLLPLVTVQNGLETERIALRSFAAVTAIVVWVPATFVVPGEIVNHADPVPAVLWLGRYPSGLNPVAAGIAADLRRGGFAVHEVEDIAAHKAAKLLGNLLNSLDALYEDTELRAAAVAALRAEARTVYEAAGIAAAKPDPGVFRAVDIPGYTRQGNSTRQSLARSAVPETDYLDGEIVLLARLHGVPAPLNEAIQSRVHRAVAEGTPAGSLSDDDLAATLPGVAAPSAAPSTTTSSTTVPSTAAAAVPDAGALAEARASVLVTAEELHRRVAEPQPPVLLDVRWALGDPHGADHYREGHLPGAVYVDLDTELAGPHAPGAGRHPLPSPAQLQAAARRWGVTDGASVVVYDNSGGLAASRAWWLLRWAGVSEVRILDGGLAAWRAAGYTEASGAGSPRRAGDVVLTGGRLPVLTADEAAALPGTGTLLDARAGERYRGEVEPIDPRAGHIPGAVSAPTGENLTAGVPYFKPADELRARFADVTGEVGVYCGSGVTAAHQIAALATIGVEAALYPGSWSAWSSDPSRPAATGAQP